MYIIVGAIGGVISGLVLDLCFPKMSRIAKVVIGGFCGGLVFCIIVAKLVGDL